MGKYRKMKKLELFLFHNLRIGKTKILIQLCLTRLFGFIEVGFHFLEN